MNKDRLNSGGELVPLRHFADENALDVRNLERLRSAWPVIAGPNSRITHPISVRHGLLLIGCSDSFALKSLRGSADQTWPEMRDRIFTSLKIRLQRIEITPSDPEPEPLPPETQAAQVIQEIHDPLDSVLRYYGNAVTESSSTVKATVDAKEKMR
jgi:hypothetical protein